MSCAHVHRVDDHFRARLAPAAEHQLRLHLPECAVCRGRYERQQLLERLSPRRPNGKQRLARALGLRSPPRGRLRLPFAGLALAGAAAIALLVWARPSRSPEFGVRGAPLTAPAATTELQLFRVVPGGRPEAVHGSISAHDELGVSYRNPTGKRRLLVFARDAHDHFYWYHPAWTRAAEDPVAVPIAGGPETHELGEVVAHDFDADRVVLIALFTDEPLAVRTVETRARLQPPEKLAIPGALVVTIPLGVRR